MFWYYLRVAFSFFFTFLILTILLLASWVFLKPRSVFFVAQKIQQDLNNFSSKYSFAIGGATISWEGINSGMQFELQDFSAINNETEQTSTIPSAKVNFALLPLLQGKMQLNEIIIDGLEFQLDVADATAERLADKSKNDNKNNRGNTDNEGNEDSEDNDGSSTDKGSKNILAGKPNINRQDSPQILNATIFYQDFILEFVKISEMNKKLPINKLTITNTKVVFANKTPKDDTESDSDANAEIVEATEDTENAVFAETELTWSIPSIETIFKFVGNNITFVSKSNMLFKGEQSQLRVEGSFLGNNYLTIKNVFRNFRPDVLPNFTPNLIGLEDASLLFDGKVDMLLTDNGRVESVNYEISLSNPGKTSNILDVASIDNKQFSLRGVTEIKQNSSRLSQKNNLSYEANAEQNFNYSIAKQNLELTAKNFSFKDILSLIPTNLMPKTKAWLQTALQEGYFSEFNINYSFIDDERLASKDKSTDVPKEVLTQLDSKKSMKSGGDIAKENDENLGIEGKFHRAIVLYDANLPHFENADGELKIDNNNIRIDFTAEANKLKVSQAIINIFDYKTNAAMLDLDCHLKGNLVDAKAFAMPFLTDGAKQVVNKLQGLIKSAKLSIQFPLHSSDIESETEINLMADIENLEANNLLNIADVSEGEFNLNLTEEQIDLNGGAILHNIYTKLHYYNKFSEKTGVEVGEEASKQSQPPLSEQQNKVDEWRIQEDEFLHLNVGVSKDTLTKLNLHNIEIQGDLDVKILPISYEERQFMAMFDATDLEIQLPYIAFHKKKDVGLNLTAKITDEPKNLLISDVYLTGGGKISKDASVASSSNNMDDINIRGDIIYSKEQNRPTYAKIDKAEYGVNNLVARYDYFAKKNSHILSVNAQTFDATKLLIWLKSNILTNYGETAKNLKLLQGNFEFALDAKNMIMLNNIKYHGVLATIFMKSSDIQAISIRASSISDGSNAPRNDDNLFFYYQNPVSLPADQEFLSITTSNMGAINDSLWKQKYVAEGSLKIAMNNGKGRKLYKGEILAQDFYLQNLPILMRILNIFSITGTLSSLQDKGIYFKKAHGDLAYQLEAKNIMLENFIIKASAMAIALQAKYNLTEQVITEGIGSFIPMYAINRLPGSIPLVGAIFSGKNEGVFATMFKITGKIGNPDIEINPASNLTPGFLRRIWQE